MSDKVAGPWTWFNDDRRYAVRFRVGSEDKMTGMIVAYVAASGEVEWVGEIREGTGLATATRFRGPDSDNVTQRVDAVLEALGWCLQAPDSDIVKADPPPASVTAERVLNALRRNPDLMREVKRALVQIRIAEPWTASNSLQRVRMEALGNTVLATVMERVFPGKGWLWEAYTADSTMRGLAETEEAAKAAADAVLRGCPDVILIAA